ncbi:YaaR family protein [Aquibacillus saliphilus]|uniref:YaaR family protein n=1 Tax=Aquibacillus saliphilus TaxID=1909422 RepID=UPI001CEFC36F|nr:YaaR family protein [Aquibacillus saliphilus]
MKISQDLHAQLESSKKNPLSQSKGTKSFDAVVESQTQKLKQQELQKLMTQLTNQGERLTKFRSFKDLAKYKRLVKDYVQETVQYGMNLKHSHSWSMDGDSRRLTIVKEIDKKLVELTDELMDTEKRSLGILEIIGEIKGLLINLYT